MSLFNFTTRQAVWLALAVCLTIESSLFVSAYLSAFDYFRGEDRQRGASVTGTIFFSNEKKLTTGQAARIEDVVEHLARIGYVEHEGNFRGSYKVIGNALSIVSRFPEFPDVTLSFNREKLISIRVAGREVRMVRIEPRQLAGFVRQSGDQGQTLMRVRRIILQPEYILDTDLLRAVISSEDYLFFDHNGINELAMAKGLMEGRGGSTLTQQLVKNSYLDSSRTIRRKSEEIMLALAVEQLLTKEEIATAYFNHCYLGEAPGGGIAIYGFGAAAREYFGKEIRELSLVESATLAALLDQPANYLKAADNGDYSALESRRERTLNLMRQNFPDQYSEQTIAAAKTEPLKFVFASDDEREPLLDSVSKPFQLYALEQMRQELGESQNEGNWHVVTTLDPALQFAAHKAVAGALPGLDQLVEQARRKNDLDPKPGESAQAAIVAMDPKTGEILAMAGNRGDVEINHATAEHSPGSVIKPFVYLMALAWGRRQDGPFTALSMINPDTDPVDYYRPRSHIGGRATAREHLARSYNFGAVHAAHAAGLPRVAEFWRRLTFRRQEPEHTGMLAIGGSAGTEVSPLVLASAFSIFATNGLQIRPTAIKAVYRDGIEQVFSRPKPARMADPAPTYVTTQMMRSALEPGGTAARALQLAGLPTTTPVVGKTGTAQISSAHFVSISPKLVVVVWVGLPDNRLPLEMKDGFSGSAMAVPIWAEFIRDGVKRFRPDLLAGEFHRPGNVRAMNIDRKQGCVADVAGAVEYFVAGREAARCSRTSLSR